MPARIQRIGLVITTSASAALGALSVVGWVFHQAAFTRLVPGGATMKPLTAVGLILGSLGLFALGRGQRRIASVGAVVMAVCGAVGLLTRFSGLPPVYVFLGSVDATVHPTLGSALSLLLLGLGTALAVRRRWWWLSQSLAVASLLLTASALCIYAYAGFEAPRLPMLAMAVHSALGLTLLGVALLFATRDGPLTQPMFVDTTLAGLGRRMGVLVIVAPWTMGLVALLLQRRFSLGAPEGLALGAVGSALVLALWLVRFTTAVSAEERDLGITLDSIGDAVLLTDSRGRVTRLNPVAEQLTGWSLDDARGLPVEQVFRIINESTRETVESPVGRVLREGRTVGLANHTVLIDRQGNERPIADSGAPVRDPSGRIQGVVLVFRDMTSEAEARRKIERTAQNLKAVMDATPVGLTAGRNGIAVYANPAALDMLGLTLEGLMGRRLLDFVVPEDLPYVQRRQSEWIAGALPAPRRMQLRRDDGSTVLIDSRPLPRVDLDGEPVQLAMMERVDDKEGLATRLARQTAFALASSELSRALSEARFDVERILETIVRLMASGPDEVALVRLLSTVDGTSLAQQALHASDPELRAFAAQFSNVTTLSAFFADVLARPEPTVITGAQLLSQMSDEAKAHAQGRVASSLVLLPLRAQGRILGVIVYARFGARPFDDDELRFVKDLAGRGAQAALNAQLYTEASNALAARARTTQELESTQAQLRHSQKLEALGQLAGGVAHDFNNLLSVILTLTELLLASRAEPDPERADLGDIKAAAERAAQLTRQLLAFSRKQVMQLQALELNVVVRDMEGILRRLMGEDVSLELALGTDVPVVHADQTLISQVVMNLAVNARDAMPTGGRVKVVTRRCVLEAGSTDLPPGEYACIDVHDQGHGIAPEVKERLFEPFFTTKPRGKGTGLGLSTSYGIARQSGGTMTVESTPGAGATFTVWLPAFAGPAPTVRVKSEPRARPSRSGTILLVEDEPLVREVARRVLSEAGYQLVVAASAEEALALASKGGHFDLLLTDVVMPGRSGRELADELLSQRPWLKVLFMSGYTEDVMVQRGVVEGRASLVQKPFTPEVLLTAVDALAPRGDSPAR